MSEHDNNTAGSTPGSNTEGLESVERATPRTNARIVWLLAAVLLLTAAAAIASALRSRLKRRRSRRGRAAAAAAAAAAQVSRPPAWAIALTVLSYVLLIPGLVYTLYYYSVSLLLFGHRVPVMEGSQTMLKLIKVVHEHDNTLAAMLIALYALVVPTLKLLMLIIGHAWQLSDRPHRRLWARRCLVIVQSISKWASPDMFAYILMMYLFRAIHHPPLISSDLTMDIGFSCFCMFCVGSTVSALGLRVPPRSAVDAGERSSKPYVTSGLCAVGVTICAATFMTLMCLGIAFPCMSLGMDMDYFYEFQPNLLPFKAFLDAVNLEDKVYAEVSVWQCTRALAQWFYEGDGNSGIALVMFAVFVLLITFANMACLLVVALQLNRPFGFAKAKLAMAASRVLGKLSMLDVSVMGVLVVTLAMRDFRSKGIVVSLRWGTAMLFGAEVCHYAAFALVRSAHTCRPKIPGTNDGRRGAESNDVAVDV